MSHVTRVCAHALPRTWMSHVTHANESCHTYERVVSHTFKNHLAVNNDERTFRLGFGFKIVLENICADSGLHKKKEGNMCVESLV